VFISEPGASDVLDLWARADDVVCIAAGYLEVRSAIARRLTGRVAARARHRLDALWERVEPVAVDGRLIGLAAKVVDVHRLRTLDALHLAAALALGKSELVLASWDSDLRRAAEAEGLVIAP
jgi:predicted nucleic acid-binding protein